MVRESQTQRKKNTKTKVRRKSIRFKPDPGTLALVLTDSQGKKLSVPQIAIVVEEAYRGCSLLIVKELDFAEGDVLTVQVGHLSPLKAEIRWKKNYEGKFEYMGLQYLTEKKS